MIGVICMQQTGRQPAGSRIDSAAVGATTTTRSFFQSQTCEADKAELQHESIYRDTSQATTGKDPAT